MSVLEKTAPSKVLSSLRTLDYIGVAGTTEPQNKEFISIHVAPKVSTAITKELSKLAEQVAKDMELLVEKAYPGPPTVDKGYAISPSTIVYYSEGGKFRTVVKIWPDKVIADAVANRKTSEEYKVTPEETARFALEFSKLMRTSAVQNGVETEVNSLRRKMVELLSDENLVSSCADNGPLQLLPIDQDSEGGLYYLCVGFADNKYSRERFGKDVGNQLSFYLRVDFNSLSLNSILSLSGGIDAHVNDIDGTVKKIERVLDENITHMPLNALKEGKCDKTLENLVQPHALVDPKEAEHPERHGYWLKGKRALTPELLEETVKESLGKHVLKIRRA